MTDLGRDARALVARVKRQDGPTAADRARLRRRLEPAWAAQGAESIAEGPEVTPQVTHGWVSWVCGLLLMSFGFMAPEAPRVITPLAVQAKSVVAGHAAAAALAAHGGEHQRPIAVQPAAARELARSETPTQSVRAAERRVRLRPARKAPQPTAASAVAAAPTAEPESEPEPQPQPEPEPEPAAPRELPRRIGEAPARPSAAVERGADAVRGTQVAPNVHSRAFAPQPIDDELTWLSAAQDALRNNQPSAALRLVQEHAFRFPQGALASERVAVQALALCALSRKTAARDVLSDLEHRAPNSPLLARVRRNCGF